MSVLIAVDPGMSGAIAWENKGYNYGVEKMPETECEICDLIKEIRNGVSPLGKAVAFVEDVPIGMPGKGAASSKLNRNAGFIRGVLAALDVRVEMIRPAKWQAHFGVGKRSGCKSDTEWKNKLKQVAGRLYPTLKPTLATADALLLLDYARTQGAISK